MIDLPTRQRIAEALLKHPLSPEGFAPCPGRHKHTGRDGQRDFRVTLDGAPTGHCFHAHCSDEVEAFNRELRRRIAIAEGDSGEKKPSLYGITAPPPRPPRQPKRPPFDVTKLREFAGRCHRSISLDWLAVRSPVAIPLPENQTVETATALFLETLYLASERVLVFTRNTSQGDYLWEAGRGSFRLAHERGVSAVPSPLPAGGPEGVWFLTNPVDGLWHINHATKQPGDTPKWGRRHSDCVTSWRFLVLESDEADPGLWLRALVQLPLRIAAIYTSGGRSIHALVRLNVGSKPEWDAVRDGLLPVLCPLGADPAAMTAVRLSRLPGCLRFGSKDKAGKLIRYDAPRLQRLAWLHPEPPLKPLIDLAK